MTAVLGLESQAMLRLVVALSPFTARHDGILGSEKEMPR